MHREQEFWIEHQIQHGKSTTSHRTTSNPELVIANQLALEQALRVAKVAGPTDGSVLKDFNDLMPSSRHGSSMRGSNLDVYGALDGCQLLGAGKALGRGSEDGQAALTALKYICEFNSDAQKLGWSLDCLSDRLSDSLKLYHYRYADRMGLEVLKSHCYGLEYKRASHWALVSWEDEGFYVADIQFFCHAHFQAENDGPSSSAASASSPPAAVLRFAVCKLYAATKIDSYTGVRYKAQIAKAPQYRNYGVLVGEMQRKLIANHEEGSASSFFADYEDLQYSMEP